jgi:aminoglycoside/choline kinase family phosphotransferase
LPGSSGDPQAGPRIENPMIPERRAALDAFARATLGPATSPAVPASADASFRSYFRVARGDERFIVMNAPPEREDIGPWLDIGRRLREAGLNAPEVLAADPALGFVVMRDLGTRSYLDALADDTVGPLYADALAALVTMQARVDARGLPRYDAPRLRAEMELMPTWFLERHLGLAPGRAGWELLESAFAALERAALAQPVAFVHRDYHSRNLMVVPDANPGIIDFQDAVVGPVTYDLVSLLRDCYVAWPDPRVRGWAEDHRRRLAAEGLVDADRDAWQAWFDLMGLQRHVKVLGIFCRLWYRDGKPGYLADLPLVLRYTLDVAARHPETRDLGRWLAAATRDRDITRAVGS